ncbi:MAG: hypothetical protein LBS14_01080 [Holosporaceae bacterium]|jgi:hypothetical protein|nr:hypothetical protein [Holosporaceae bacterium]
MAEEIDSIIQEISEEVKNDQLFAYLNKYKREIATGVGAIVVGIVIYSSWYSGQNRRMKEITNAFLEELQAPVSKDSTMVLEALISDAPEEMRPILNIVIAGKNIVNFKEIQKYLDELLSLSKKRSVDIVWRDLAVLILTSYRLKSLESLLGLLEPLTEANRPFRFAAMESIALILEDNGECEKSQSYLQKILDDETAPRTLKKRISILKNYLKNKPKKR